jgi:hypothetical protein
VAATAARPEDMQHGSNSIKAEDMQHGSSNRIPAIEATNETYQVKPIK